MEINFDISHCELFSSFEEIATGDAFQIFPNPVLDIINIENFNPIESVEIYNSIRQIIEIFYSQKNNIKQINISNYSSGCYFICINNNKTLQSFIKNNL